MKLRQGTAVMAIVVVAAGLCAKSATAGTVLSANPYWFRDDYSNTDSVNLAASTAVVDTAGPGTLELPYAPTQAAFDPGGTYALVATEGGVYAYVYDGQSVAQVTNWNLGDLPATGVAWIQGGDAFAVSTAARVVVYGLTQLGGVVLAAQAAVTGVIGVAPGPSSLPSSVLVATPTGAQVMEAQGTSLVRLSGGPSDLVGNLGVAATADGSVAATWQNEAVQLWAWDGDTYVPAVSWDPPTPPLAAGPVRAVAFFPQGGGYWVLTQEGQLLAYAYGPPGLSVLPGWSLSVPSDPDTPMTVVSGWGSTSAAVVYPTGWDYEDVDASDTFMRDSMRSLSGRTWSVYQSEAVAESVELPVGHPVSAARLEDADCAPARTPPDCVQRATVPQGTTVSYELSTDGCQSWITVALFTNATLPAGSDLCYRIALTTVDPTLTPVVDVINLYEIAQRRNAGVVASLLCTGRAC